MSDRPTDLPEWEHRAVQKDDGKWEVLDGWGYSECFQTFHSQAEAEAWISGYESGARANM